jgi:alpha-L-fucosidase 2
MPRALTLLALTAALATASPNGGTSLRYDKPATDWTEALPVGNGSLGGMIFGGPDKERIQFNEQTLWTGDERGPELEARAQSEVSHLSGAADGDEKGGRISTNVQIPLIP